MANSFVANSGFDDLESEAYEAGASGQANQKQQSQASDNAQTSSASNLYSNPYLNLGTESFARAPEPQISWASDTRYESTKKSIDYSKGTLTFDTSTISPEKRIEMIQKELSQAIDKVEAEEEVSKVSKVSEVSKVENKLQKQAEKTAVNTIVTVHKVSKGIFGFLKDVFSAFKGIVDLMTFRIYNPEQKKKMEEEKKKKEARGAVKRSFFGKISENSQNLYIQTNRKLVELEDRLGITGLTTELRNKYLGRRRNASYEERNIHLAHFTAQGMQEEMEEQERIQKQVKVQETQTKGGMDLNKVAEGGSILSSTGGQGAG